MAKTQLLLLDDHTLFRAMLSRLLDSEPDFRVVAHCSSSQEALEALGRRPFDLVLLDYDLGNKFSITILAINRTGFSSCEARARRATGAGSSS